jgi:hypothetical protein
MRITWVAAGTLEMGFRPGLEPVLKNGDRKDRKGGIRPG